MSEGNMLNTVKEFLEGKGLSVQVPDKCPDNVKMFLVSGFPCEDSTNVYDIHVILGKDKDKISYFEINNVLGFAHKNVEKLSVMCNAFNSKSAVCYCAQDFSGSKKYEITATMLLPLAKGIDDDNIAPYIYEIMQSFIKKIDEDAKYMAEMFNYILRKK